MAGVRKAIGAGLAAIVLGAVTIGLHAQSATGTDSLTFEVASVKPNTAGCPPACGLIRPTIGNQGYHAEGATLRTLMTVAYTVTDRQISGGPAWMNTDRFDIDAKAARPRTNDELHVMLQHLLEERFQLKLRHEARQEAVSALTVAKGGPKLPVHDPEDKDFPPMGPQLVRAADGSVCMGLTGRNVKMNYFAFVLSRLLGRNVIDQTGLPDRYDVKVQYAPDVAPKLNGGDLPISPDCHDMFSALTSQVGLKLESTKGPVEYLVVERVEKPTEN